MGVLKTATNFLTATIDDYAPIEDYLPTVPKPGTIFYEGYLNKRSRHSYVAILSFIFLDILNIGTVDTLHFKVLVERKVTMQKLNYYMLIYLIQDQRKFLT